MRSILTVLAASAVLGAAATAVAIDPGCSTCGNCQGSGFAAPPCGAPLYGTPGCCECPPGPCDNAWDGYCEHKAFWQAIWHNVGTGAYGGRHRMGRCAAPAQGTTCTPGGVIYQQPAPAGTPRQLAPGPVPAGEPPAAPEPVAEQAAWGWYQPWVR